MHLPEYEQGEQQHTGRGESNPRLEGQNRHRDVPGEIEHTASLPVTTDSGVETAQLADFGAEVRDQDDLERDIGRQADQLLLVQADERDKKRLEKTQDHRRRLEGQIAQLQQKLTEFGNHTTKSKYRAEIDHYSAEIAELDKDLQQIQKRIDGRLEEADENERSASTGDANSKRLPGESHREFLIRTGKITPFSNIGKQLLKTSSNLGDVLLDAENESGADEDNEEEEEGERPAEERPQSTGLLSHRNLRAPGFDEELPATSHTLGETDGDAELARKLQEEEYGSGRANKRRRLQVRRPTRNTSKKVRSETDDSDVYIERSDEDGFVAHQSGIDSDSDETDEVPFNTTPGRRRLERTSKGQMTLDTRQQESEDLAGIDDGNEQVYQARMKSWIRRRRATRLRRKEQLATEDGDAADDDDFDQENGPGSVPEWNLPHPSLTNAEFEGGLRIPGDVYPSLFDYQKTGVQWLWELYSQQVGGIIGDEMGLGKTIQVISFLAGLHFSDKLTKPIIVVCPATVMKQWVNEFHRWWPPLRVSILHTSGSGMLNVGREARIEDDLENTSYLRQKTQTKGHKAAKRIVDKVVRDGHVLVTTYSGLQTYAELLIPTDWEYAVLDEGHKIRNPNTAITVYCKELRTHNRIILSGTPMQNNLAELWSLFDFIFPMRLGTLVNFRNQFEIPIKQGGYANASNLQVETAMKCAETLKDTISPYLLQRFKIDVAADLPKKSERVLFCKLTTLQRDEYEKFLASEEMQSIFAGKRQALYGVDILRKLCNHPDLVDHRTLSKKANYNYGSGSKSGKMQVVKALLEVWRKNGHKTLLFAQHRIMLDILERFIQSFDGFNYCRMDGNTSIKDRQDLVDKFNRDPDQHVFLLTTKVGGLGVNLTGANRVIIYDPDWNPSTDVQARERAWRLGQKREVEIYRLMTVGTIEEKIYHRQIFKQFLTNKILRDPKQRQTFHLRDLHDLFTLGDAQADGQTETGSIFKGTEVKLSGSSKLNKAKTDNTKNLPTPPSDEVDTRGQSIGTIAGISRQEQYQDEAQDGKTGEEAEEAGAQKDSKDDRMLSSIFSRTGVHSALEHDAIINGRKTVRADPEIIAREARRVAGEAAKELKRAGNIARTIPAGEVTWTGQVGTAGRPEDDTPPSRRGGMVAGRGGRGGRGPSSASVLANLQSRQSGSSSSPHSSQATSSAQQTPAQRRRDEQHQPRGKDFLVLIRDYLLSQGGSAHTQMLIDHFNRFCRTEARTAEFKEMLKTIAELEKGGRGRGRWVLRDEYRPRAAT